jgi:hypothetical protein
VIVVGILLERFLRVPRGEKQGRFVELHTSRFIEELLPERSCRGPNRSGQFIEKPLKSFWVSDSFIQKKEQAGKNIRLDHVDLSVWTLEAGIEYFKWKARRN